MTQNDPEAQEFRKNNRNVELNTFQVYEWLEKEAWEIAEFRELVDNALQAVETGDEGKEISIVPATEKLANAFRQQFVPLSSRDEYTKLAIPQITLYLVLWALVEKVPRHENRRVMLRGWDLALLHGVWDRLTAVKRGALMFTDKEYSKSGTSILVRFVGFDKLESDLRCDSESHDFVMSAPFEMWSLSESQIKESSLEAHSETCLICGKHGKTTKAKILPEREKRHYDNPQRDENAEVCARCVQVWSLSPISTVNDNYAIVEVPVENFLELFALYESIEGISRLETLKTLNRVSSLSVFPNKYLLLSRSPDKGKMPQTAQYYLQLSRQPHFMERLGDLDEDLEVMAAQDRAKLAREVALTLSVIQRLPYYHASSNDEKVPAMSIINALDRGRPYEALYVAAAQAHEAGRREAQTISGGVESYDDKVLRFGEFFARRQKGTGLRKEIFRDVRMFSDYLDSILRPIVSREVEDSGSSVSGVARKYTENITKSFVRVNTADFLYRVASFTEARERKDLRKGLPKAGQLKGITRKSVRGTNEQEVGTEAEDAKLKLEQELERYYDRYSGNERDWKTFLEEVEARTLALLLLNVSNKKG
jgi:DNA-binding transcriptional regulator GbsR (MarR family)